MLKSDEPDERSRMGEPVESAPRTRTAQAGPKLTPAPRLMLRESVYEAMKRLLMDHEMEPGARLSIDGLARDLQVSPTPVREALFRCEAEGLVVRKANAGYTVAPLLDFAGLNNLYDIRLLLEPVAAQRAATLASNAARIQMQAFLQSMTATVAGDKYEAYRDFANSDAQFHGAIAAAGGNPLIAETVGRLRAHTHGYRLYFRRGIAHDVIDEHTKIMNAILGKDPAAAETAMRSHLERSRARLESTYQPDAEGLASADQIP
jgi:DNA-binding GntR family transcriptional regulator